MINRIKLRRYYDLIHTMAAPDMSPLQNARSHNSRTID